MFFVKWWKNFKNKHKPLVEHKLYNTKNQQNGLLLMSNEKNQLLTFGSKTDSVFYYIGLFLWETNIT